MSDNTEKGTMTVDQWNCSFIFKAINRKRGEHDTLCLLAFCVFKKHSFWIIFTINVLQVLGFYGKQTDFI